VSPRAGLRLALLVPLSVAGAAVAEESLLGCRRIDAAAERLACYDRVVDRARDELAPEAPPPEPQVSSVPAPRAEEAPEDRTLRERLFGRSESEGAQALRKTYGLDTPNEISASVSAAKLGGDRLLLITLANGQVWKQAETVSFSLHAGDTVEIEAGLAGAYYLRRNGKGRSIRVKRIR
jgi:hypothetical protein